MSAPATITREQFELVRPLLEGGRKRTRPPIHDLYDIFLLVLYRDRTGCAWRNLPPGSPPWRSVHVYHAIWSTPPEGGGLTPLQLAYEKLESFL